MCGFCGIFNERNLRTLKGMLESIRHRGPDSFSTVLFENHSLGECGLNIVSGRGEELPLVEKDAGVALLFNGEIYNYREIRDGLSREGYVFTSDSDSEILIPLYRKYGTGFVKHLKGMFSIVIIDGDRILLARDKFGIKPLYYHRIGTRLVFGSEIKSLLRCPDVPAELDLDALEEAVVFGYVLSAEHTLLRNIRQVPPGSLISFDGVHFRKEKFHVMPSAYYCCCGEGDVPPADLDFEGCARELSNILLNTFERLNHHDGFEKGVYLSGGLDSTLMAVLCRELTDAPLQTYTLFDSQTAPDLQYARKVSRAIGSEHHEVFVTAEDYMRELPPFILHYENLVAGGVFDIQGAAAFQILSRHISLNHKVSFTGEGADELFGGYYWIYTHPLGFSDRIRKRAAVLPKGSRVHRFVKEIFPEPENEKTYRKNLFDLLVASGLANYHLWSVDRSCGAFGFEARPPYLYDDVADFALSLPIEFKVADKTATKLILKKAACPYFEKHGLEDILNRKKYGMPAALGSIEKLIQRKVAGMIPENVVDRHPFKKYFRTPMEILMFDLFYYSTVYMRGSLEEDFSTRDFYRSGINEDMYDQQISSHSGGDFIEDILAGQGAC